MSDGKATKDPLDLPGVRRWSIPYEWVTSQMGFRKAVGSAP